MKKIKFYHPSDRKLIFILVLIIGLMAAILAFYGQRLNILWQQNGNGNLYSRVSEPDNDLMSTDLKFYIQNAIRSLYNAEPATDVAQQRIYIPEARIYLPLTAYSRTLVYRYDDSFNGSPASLTLTSSANSSALPNSFIDVPCLQRHVTILINSKDNSYGDGAFIGSVKLSDGRNLNIYKRDGGSCNEERWQQGSPDQVVNLIKQAKSY